MPPAFAMDQKAKTLREQGALNSTPQDVKDHLFQTNTFFDQRDLVQVKYEMLRRIHLDGWTVTEATQVFGLSRPTFYQAQKAFKENGLIGLLPRKRGPKGAYKLTEEIVTFMEDVQENDPSLKARALAKIVLEEFDITVHPRSIERVLASKKKHRKLA